jgi:hypothetical protein
LKENEMAYRPKNPTNPIPPPGSNAAGVQGKVTFDVQPRIAKEEFRPTAFVNALPVADGQLRPGKVFALNPKDWERVELGERADFSYLWFNAKRTLRGKMKNLALSVIGAWRWVACFVFAVVGMTQVERSQLPWWSHAPMEWLLGFLVAVILGEYAVLGSDRRELERLREAHSSPSNSHIQLL